MSILQKTSDQHQKKPVIDLSGPGGNALSLIATARDFCQRFPIEESSVWPKTYSQQDRERIEDDMMSDDYDHLLEVFDREFGVYVDLVWVDDSK